LIFNRNSIIIDTGFLLALFVRDDSLHQKAKKISKKYNEAEWITTWPVLTELFHMTPSDIRLRILKAQQKGLFRLYSLEEKHLSKTLNFVEKYIDQDVDLADISLIILAEYLGHGKILSCDQRDFSILRWNQKEHFQNLLTA